jgi:hypothetical protein
LVDDENGDEEGAKRTRKARPIAFYEAMLPQLRPSHEASAGRDEGPNLWVQTSNEVSTDVLLLH